MCLLYILPRLHKNVFKRILQRFMELTLILNASDTGSALPQLFSGGLSPAGGVTASGLPDHAGRRGFRGFPVVAVADRLAAAGAGRFELGKSEKNRRNPKLIQTCDFLFLCILYIIFCNVTWRDVNFHFITFNSSFLAMFLRPKILKSLLRRFFC